MLGIQKKIVILEPIEHKYIHTITGEVFKSVTTVISSIEHKFDVDGVAQSIANQKDDDPKKNKDYIGMSKDRIVAYWQEINDAANEYGTHVHEVVEQYLLNDKWFFPDNEFDLKVCRGYDALNVDEGITMWPERVLFAEEYKLAGTTDLIVDIDNQYFSVGDWKTNRKFNFYSEYKQTLKKPFEYLQDCQFVVYTLQLSVYALMYEMETGKKCRDIWVGYWNKESCTFSKINLMYMRHEAEKLLKLHKYNTELNNN
jgi:hypothetical protein